MRWPVLGLWSTFLPHATPTSPPTPPATPTSISRAVLRELVQPGQLLYTGEDWLHLGLVMAGVGMVEHPEQYYVTRLHRLVKSAVKYSDGVPLHLVFISDRPSLETISSQVESSLGSILLRGLLVHSERWIWARHTFPPVRVEFVDITAITDPFRHTIEHMKLHFNRWDEAYRYNDSTGDYQYWPASKYHKDLFYVSPFYHLVFPFKQMMVVDADIEFRASVPDIYSQLEQYSGEQVVSLGPDLGPYYRIALHAHRTEQPDSELGEPGRLQGVNTGVVLLHLARMRESEMFNTFLQTEEIDRVCNKLHFKSFFGDQVSF